MLLFDLQLGHGCGRYIQVQHLQRVVLRAQPLALQVSSSSGKHRFDQETSVPTLHRYQDVVIAGRDHLGHRLLDPHPIAGRAI